MISWRNLRGVFGALRRHEGLVLLVDWGYREDGIPVKMFGSWTTLPAGPAILAARHGSTIVPFSINRLPDGTFRAVGDDPILVPSDSPSDLAIATQKIATALEGHIAPAPGAVVHLQADLAGHGRGDGPAWRPATAPPWRTTPGRGSERRTGPAATPPTVPRPSRRRRDAERRSSDRPAIARRTAGSPPGGPDLPASTRRRRDGRPRHRRPEADPAPAGAAGLGPGRPGRPRLVPRRRPRGATAPAVTSGAWWSGWRPTARATSRTARPRRTRKALEALVRSAFVNHAYYYVELARAPQFTAAWVNETALIDDTPDEVDEPGRSAGR